MADAKLDKVLEIYRNEAAVQAHILQKAYWPTDSIQSEYITQFLKGRRRRYSQATWQMKIQSDLWPQRKCTNTTLAKCVISAIQLIALVVGCYSIECICNIDHTITLGLECISLENGLLFMDDMLIVPAAEEPNHRTEHYTMVPVGLNTYKTELKNQYFGQTFLKDIQSKVKDYNVPRTLQEKLNVIQVSYSGS